MMEAFWPSHPANCAQHDAPSAISSSDDVIRSRPAWQRPPSQAAAEPARGKAARLPVHLHPNLLLSSSVGPATAKARGLRRSSDHQFTHISNSRSQSRRLRPGSSSLQGSANKLHAYNNGEGYHDTSGSVQMSSNPTFFHTAGSSGGSALRSQEQSGLGMPAGQPTQPERRGRTAGPVVEGVRAHGSVQQELSVGSVPDSAVVQSPSSNQASSQLQNDSESPLSIDAPSTLLPQNSGARATARGCSAPVREGAMARERTDVGGGSDEVSAALSPHSGSAVLLSGLPRAPFGSTIRLIETSSPLREVYSDCTSPHSAAAGAVAP